MSSLLLSQAKILPLPVELCHCPFSAKKAAQGRGLSFFGNLSPIQSSCKVRRGEVVLTALDEAANHCRVSPQPILLVALLCNCEHAAGFNNYRF